MSNRDVVCRLLDAAFNELQHDTGPQDAEYRHQRSSLEKRFSTIISNQSPPPEKAEEEASVEWPKIHVSSYFGPHAGESSLRDEVMIDAAVRAWLTRGACSTGDRRLIIDMINAARAALLARKKSTAPDEKGEGS